MNNDECATKGDIGMLTKIVEANSADINKLVHIVEAISVDIARLEKKMHEEFTSLAESIRDLAQMTADRFNRMDVRFDKLEHEVKLHNTVLVTTRVESIG